ncbi:MAG: NAD(P)/FAD-dependent oxidoreductase [Pseudomonadota bacterium]
MPFDAMGRRAANQRVGRRLRVAVIGGGISGLSAAWLLSGRHEVIVYERDRRLGGHANTIDVPLSGKTVAVDAGFIVFNKRNYPNLTALFEALGVAVETADMSFAASLCDGGVEYSGRDLSAIFADRKSLASPSHWVMLADIVRFNREAKSALERGLEDSVSLGAFVEERKFSHAFVNRFLVPMAAAIWSTPSIRILDYPAASLFRFYANHGLLQTSNIPQWNTVSGGSRTYVERISERFHHQARLCVGVVSVERASGAVIVTDEKGAADRFDEVVIATHADRALAMLKNPTDRERALLGAFAYQPNRAVAHFDKSQMPIRRRAWASWNYLGGDGAAAVTYWMNLLQNIKSDRDIFVTLNPLTPVRDEDVIAEFEYDHPMFDIEAGRAQKELWSLQGVGGVWFCGAHFGSGFHEDGLQAGLAVAEDLGGVRRPWTVAGDSARIWRQSPPVAAAAE